MTQPNRLIQAILVPQGAEYRAVCRGLRAAKRSLPVLPIPVGSLPLNRQLEIWKQDKVLGQDQAEQNQVRQNQTRKELAPQVLLMGLCGSLSPDCAIGDLVLYQECMTQSQEIYPCASSWIESLRSLKGAHRVQSLTIDRIISTASEKRYLWQTYVAKVVDMEGAIVLQSLTPSGVSVAMLRVVSDGYDRNIPNLNMALKPDGSLDALSLALAFCKEPIAAAHLIRGSLRGLQTLQSTTTALFTELSDNPQ
jgi:Phosphorylase superfamily